jgi:hypothetical protein
MVSPTGASWRRATLIQRVIFAPPPPPGWGEGGDREEFESASRARKLIPFLPEIPVF